MPLNCSDSTLGHQRFLLSISLAVRLPVSASAGPAAAGLTGAAFNRTSSGAWLCAAQRLAAALAGDADVGAGRTRNSTHVLPTLLVGTDMPPAGGGGGSSRNHPVVVADTSDFLEICPEAELPSMLDAAAAMHVLHAAIWASGMFDAADVASRAGDVRLQTLASPPAVLAASLSATSAEELALDTRDTSSSGSTGLTPEGATLGSLGFVSPALQASSLPGIVLPGWTGDAVTDRLFVRAVRLHPIATAASSRHRSSDAVARVASASP